MKKKLPKLFLLISFCLFFTSALQSQRGYAQVVTSQEKDLSNVKCSIMADRTTVQSLFDQIQKQTSYNIICVNQSALLQKQVSINIPNSNLGDVLRKLSSKAGFIYTVLGNKIIIKSADASASAATRQIRGHVADKNKEALPGVTVLIKGSASGTATNLSGDFNLKVANSDVLVFTFMGYKPKEVAVTNAFVYSVVMDEDVKGLSEVVVTALGIKREEKALGYAVQQINGEQLTAAPTSNFLNALDGKVPGISIQRADGPMGSSDIILRGDKSLLLGSSGALIVIDGIPVSNKISGTGAGAYSTDEANVDFGTAVSDLNPEDIANVSVLKGPGATALYGARGANGAIVITTKSGSAHKGLGVSISSNTSFDQVNRWPDYQYQYGQGVASGVNYYSYSASEDGASTGGTSSAWGPRLNTGSKFFQYDPTTQKQGLERTDWVAYPDNRKGLFRTGVTTNNTISVEGGNKVTTGRVSVNRIDNRYILENTGYKRTSINFSLNQKISDKINLGTKVNYYNKSSDNLPGLGYSNKTASYYMIFVSPNIDLDWFRNYWITKDVSQSRPFSSVPDNPFFSLYEEINPMRRNGIFGNINFSYNITPQLTLTAKTGIDWYDDISSTRQPMSSHSYANGFYKEQNIIRYEQNSEFLLSYKKPISKDIKTSISFGGNNMHSMYNRTQAYLNKLLTPGVYTLGNAVERPFVTGYKEEKVINSFYGFANFSFKDYLFLELTARNDWSSVFSASHNSYFYPSANLSLVLSDLLHLNPNKISYAKLRFAYAKVGNDTSPYRIDKYYAQSNFSSSVTNPTVLPNPDLKPESTQSYEIGAEARFFKNRLGFDFAAYLNDSYDQILSVPVENASGYYNYVMNAGLVRNKGLELQIWVSPVATAKFSWKTTVNGAINRGTIVRLSPSIERLELYGMGSSGVSLLAVPGGSIGDIYGRGYLRNANGDILYQNGVPQLSTEITKQGSAVPDFKGGITNTFKYKDFMLTVQFDGEFGGKKYSLSNSSYATGGKTAITVPGREEGGILGTGVIQNADGTFRPNDVVVSPSAYYTAHYDRTNAEANLFDASYIKFRECRLDYVFKPNYIKRLGLSTASVGLYGRDLFLWTKWPVFDPESSTLNGGIMIPGIEVGQFPATRTMGVNLRVSF